jgi:hypothetical protein
MPQQKRFFLITCLLVMVALVHPSAGLSQNPPCRNPDPTPSGTASAWPQNAFVTVVAPDIFAGRYQCVEEVMRNFNRSTDSLLSHNRQCSPNCSPNHLETLSGATLRIEFVSLFARSVFYSCPLFFEEKPNADHRREFFHSCLSLAKSPNLHETLDFPSAPQYSR